MTEFEEGFAAGIEAAARWLDAVPRDVYPEDIFLPIPPEKRARDGVAADLLREMAPCWAKAVRRIESPERGEEHRDQQP